MWGWIFGGTSLLYLWGQPFVAGWLVGGWPGEDVSANQHLQSRSKGHSSPLRPWQPFKSVLAQRVHCTRDRVLQRALRVGLEAEPAPAHSRRLHLPHCCFPRQILTQLQYPKVQRHERITFVCHFLLYSSFLIVVSGNLFAIVLFLPFPSAIVCRFPKRPQY